MLSRDRLVRLVVLGGTLPCAGVAMGDTVVAQFNSVSPHELFRLSLNNGASYSAALAGRMNWTRTGGTSTDAPEGNFSTFCIELTQHVAFNQSYEFNVVTLDLAPSPGGDGVGDGMGISKADQLSEFWGEHRSNVVDNLTAAAFQIGIWEIVYDDNLHLGTGTFIAQPLTVTPQQVSLAQQWLDDVNGVGARSKLLAMSSSTRQDQVFEVPSTPAPAIPAPGAAWGAVPLLGLVGWWQWKRTRKA